ncbi:MAG: zinc ribbon domain-containing protein [Clostridia bacterium]|nr:zinc ribbon domain-containing protein [Clostridia bacterium]
MANILDNVVSGISQGVNSISEGAKNLVGKTGMNTQIQNLEREKNAVFQNLGSLVYTLQTSGAVNIDQIGSMCEQIKGYNDQIENLKNQIKMLDAQKGQNNHQAAVCQQPVNPESAPADGVANMADAKFCGKCGNANKPEAKFCARCGGPLNG